MFERTRNELRRLVTPLVALGVAFVVAGWFSEFSKLALLSYKVSLASIAAIIAHLIRSELFPYLDLSSALDSGDRGKAIGSAIVVGLVFASIVLAICLGL